MKSTRLPPTFGELWRRRYEGVELQVDRLLPYNLSILVVYVATRMRVGPNPISLLSGATALGALVLGLTLPATELSMSILLIFAVSQLAYVFDCADGQLARVTDCSTRFGDFLDKSIDIVAFTAVFGGYFGYLYRHLDAVGQNVAADRWLLLGFLFLMARTSRFAIWQRLQIEEGPEQAKEAQSDGAIITVLKNYMDMESSVLGMLWFVFSPLAGFVWFSGQTIIMVAVYARYFGRAKTLLGD